MRDVRGRERTYIDPLGAQWAHDTWDSCLSRSSASSRDTWFMFPPTRQPHKYCLLLPPPIEKASVPDAEQMPAEQPDGLERNARAYHARVVVDVRHDGEERLTHGLDQ